MTETAVVPAAAPAPARRSALLLAVLVAVYLAASLVALASWSARGVTTVTGDEPHYLVMADGLARYHSLELSAPYADEFASRAIYSRGLADPGSVPAAPYAHVLAGPHGLYGWHGPGIPFLVAVPFEAFGIPGAKAVMVLLGALGVIVVWRIATVFIADPRVRFGASLAVAIAFPLIPAATQIYPDLVAGILALSGIYLVLTPGLRRSRWSLAGYSFIVGYLPWVGTKFAITAVILMAAMAWTEFRARRSLSRLAWLLLPAAALLLLLLVYDQYAFGRISGPPADGALEISTTSFMVLWGLLLDQDQGILLQNPVLWIGLCGVVPLVRRRPTAAVTWILVFASIWLPSAMHPGWYGLGSFVGRYSWALAVLFVVPALLALSLLAERSRRAFWLVVGAGVAANLAFFAIGTLLAGSAPGSPAGFDLYTKPPETWLESYAVFWFPLQDWVPALYNVDWAYTFWPNAAWLLVGVGALVIGLRIRPGVILAGAGLVAAVIVGLVSVPGPRTDVVPLDVAGGSQPGYVSGTPVRQMRDGTYQWSVTYSAASPASLAAGKWELVASDTDAVVAAGELPGTDGATTTSIVDIPYFSWRPREYALRVASYAVGPFHVVQAGVRHQ